MNEHLETLAPAPLWRHFRAFCNTPRPSWGEERLTRQIEAWADERGSAHERDASNNLVIRKPATSGCEAAPGVVLQGHLDMVGEAESGRHHDFARDAIETVVDRGWLTAVGTTLGADNGIGAAAALAILGDDELEHGPLEVLLTVAEEVSLVGASRLAADWLRARVLLNLDSEKDGEACIGCAGGKNVALDHALETVAIGADRTVVRIDVGGLTGGHSGIDIHAGRASANRLLPRVLHAFVGTGLQLVDYHGGRMDNAITRAASATVALPGAAAASLDATLAGWQQRFRAELAGVDGSVSVAFEPATAKRALGIDDSARVLALLRALPFGVERMSVAAPGVVETSNNLGVIQLADGRLQAQLMVRSLADGCRDELAERIAVLIEMAGFQPTLRPGYPGWTPNPESPVLARFKRVHDNVTGAAPSVNVIHAGLECGLIGAKYPHLDMISFGPTIRGAHSPDERVDLASVERFYRILRALVADLAGRSAASAAA